MDILTRIVPSNVKYQNRGAYLELPHGVYITLHEGAACAIIDSATDDVLVVYWSQCDATYFHYTNGLGAGEGGVEATRALIEEWLENAQPYTAQTTGA